MALKNTETQKRFEDQLRKFNEKMGRSKLLFADAQDMYSICCNLLLRYEEIRKSKDSWKQRALKAERDLKYSNFEK